MKIAVIIARTVMGLLFAMASIVVLFNLVKEEPMEGAPKAFNEGLKAAVYFIPFLKVTELVCSIAFLTGRFVPLAAVVIFPIVLNILGYHTFVDHSPPGIITGLVLLTANLFLAYAYRKNYEGLLRAK